MKIPYWNAEITAYKQNRESDGRVKWTRTKFSGCFWHRKAIRDRANGVEHAQNVYICRIPDISADVNIGDIIVHGTVSDQIDEYNAGMRSMDLMKKYAGRCMSVTMVGHNTGPVPLMAHLRVEGA